MEEEREERLIEDWDLLKDELEGFLTDPLDWVVVRLGKALKSISGSPIKRQQGWKELKTLIDILYFLNRNRKLIIG